MNRSALLLGVAAIVACVSPIPEPANIEIPAQLNGQGVQIAILSALRSVPPPASYDSRREMPDDEFESLVWNHYFAGAPLNRGWRVEKRERGRFVVSHQRGGHLLRLQVTYDDAHARVSLVESSNFRQRGEFIHGRAVDWIVKLEKRIRAELERQALRIPPPR